MEENKNIVEKEDLIDGYLVCFDIAYLPNGWNLEDWIKYVKETKVAIYDSSKINHCGDRPFSSPVDLRTVDKQQVIEGLF